MLFPHIPALFMTSLLHTPRLKMTEAMTWSHFRDFHSSIAKKQDQNGIMVCVCVCYLFLYNPTTTTTTTRPRHTNWSNLMLPNDGSTELELLVFRTTSFSSISLHPSCIVPQLAPDAAGIYPRLCGGATWRPGNGRLEKQGKQTNRQHKSMMHD